MDIVKRLSEYWWKKGCAPARQWDNPVPAATMHPAVFSALVSNQARAVYLTSLCRRPWDSQGGISPLRGLFHTQFEVFLRPVPEDERQLISGSLAAVGVELDKNEVRFVEDYWEVAELALGGSGWELYLNGIEIAQVTQIQEAGGEALIPGLEITYGLERLGHALAHSALQMSETEHQYNQYLSISVNVDTWYDMMASYRHECENALDKIQLVPALDLLNSMHHAYWVINRRSPMDRDEVDLHRSQMRGLCKRWVNLATGAKADEIYRDFTAGIGL